MNTGQTSRAIRVAVLGGGYAGMIATNRLLGSLTPDEQRRVSLTVVNPRAEFVERIRLHELAAGSRESVTIPLADVLHPAAKVVVGRARRIDPAAQSVRIETRDTEIDLAYDQLVYAVGSVGAAPFPGARQHAFLVGDFADARAAAETIKTLGPAPRVAVVGGGFTGVETASELGARYPDAVVTLFCKGLLVPDMRPAARASLTKSLQRLGVSIVDQASIAGIEPGEVRLTTGHAHRFDVCLVAASFDVPDLAAVSGLPVDERGRLRVDQHLRCLTSPSIIGAGDAVVAPDRDAAHLRMGCAVALPLGAVAAETLLATIRGTELPTVSIGLVLQCISLGRRNGYIQLVHRDDSPRGVHVGGRLAASIKEMVCTMVIERPVKEGTRPGAYSWPPGPKWKEAR